MSSPLEISNPYYLIIDLEATCCDQASFPRHEMEIIEIGAVMLNSTSFEIESEFQSFVQPVRHPQLTPFCTELTSIVQQQVDSALSFPDVMQQLSDWRTNYPENLFCSWGDYDRHQFVQDCQYHRIAYPFYDGHLNLKKAFSEAMGTKKRFGLSGAIRRLGLEFSGTHHRGIDDARNIARVVQSCLLNAPPT